MEILLSLLVSIVGGIACHYIVKWLDRNDNDNEPTKKAPEVASPGLSLLVPWIEPLSLAYWYCSTAQYQYQVYVVSLSFTRKILKNNAILLQER